MNDQNMRSPNVKFRDMVQYIIEWENSKYRE